MGRAFFGPFQFVGMDEPTVNREGTVFLSLHDSKGNVIGGTCELDFLVRLAERLKATSMKHSAYAHQD
jgi:phage protein U